MRKINYKILLLIFLSLEISCFDIFASKSTYSAEKDSFYNPSSPKNAEAYTLHIGAWIIVAGDKEDHDLYYMIEQGCNSVYNSIINLGFSSNDIYYLAADWDGSLPTNADAESTKGNIEYAITTWAKNKVDENNALGLYLLDHGGFNTMCIPGVDLSGDNLDSYLDTLESTTTMARSLIIYEACHSGSFIEHISKNGRIIICSTDKYHNAYPNPDLTHAVFSEHFWAALTMGYKLGYCFEYATECVDLWGLSDIQKPWIDDNHDNTGHEVNSITGDLPNGGDGYDVEEISLGTPIASLKYVNLIKCSIKKFLPFNQQNITLWVVAENNSKMEFIRARIFPWWFKWPTPKTDENRTYYFSDDDFSDFSYFDLTFNKDSSKNGEKNYSITIDTRRYPGIFGDGKGDYRILFEAKVEDGKSSKPLRTEISLNDEGIAPLDLISPSIIIKSPNSNTRISDRFNITVKADDDQALNLIKVVLDGILINESIMSDFYPYPIITYNLDSKNYENGVHNITAIAIDKSGNQQQISIFVVFQNNESMSIFNFDYQPYLIGASVGIATTLLITILCKRKKK
ncbi:C13 family peptidase [Candidatus Harpocratesius sp.]